MTHKETITAAEKVPKNKAFLLWELFKTFFILGGFTIGGGIVMVPLIEKELVKKKGWIKAEEFIDMMALIQSVPGVMTVNSAIIVGYRLAGLSGAMLSVLGGALPSFVVILVIASFFVRFNQYPIIQKFLLGARPGVVALLIYAAISLGKKGIRDKKGILIFVSGLLALYFLNIHPIIVIIVSGFLGYIIYHEGRVK